MSVPSNCLLGVCSMCGTPVHDVLCFSCTLKASPQGPPLKRIRRFGFKPTYAQRQCMNLSRDVCKAIPTEVHPESGSVKMSHLFVACDGKTYVGHEWISRNGGLCFSWSESHPHNNAVSGQEPAR